MQDAIKDIFGPMFEAMLQGEMDSHLVYESNNHGPKSTENRRNGYSSKTLKSTYGDIPVEVPRDRDASFEPQAIPKRTRDVSGIEDKVLAMYARGMSQRDIAETVEDIYGFEISHDTISAITDRVTETAEGWQNRPLKKFYAFLFVDCLYVSVRKEMETKTLAVYVILGYDVNGIKDILGLWIGEAEGKHYWMQIFDEIKARGVEDVLFISMDGVSGLEEGAMSIFKDAVVQCCIVHLIRNSIKYIPSKDYKTYTAQLKKVYGAPSLKAAEAEFERFKQAWSQYPGAVEVWVHNWQHVEQLFNYGSAVRKVMHTTNSIEAVNSSLRKVTKKGSFPGEEAVRKALYLRITELYKKWNGRPVSNWALVRNQLAMDDKIQARIMKYENYSISPTRPPHLKQEDTGIYLYRCIPIWRNGHKRTKEAGMEGFGITSDSQKRAQARYDAEHTTRISLKFNTKTDLDIIRWLWRQRSKQGAIKRLIREDIARMEAEAKSSAK